MQVADNVVSRKSHWSHEGSPSEYDQPRELYERVMTQTQRDHLHHNTAKLLKVGRPYNFIITTKLGSDLLNPFQPTPLSRVLTLLSPLKAFNAASPFGAPFNPFPPFLFLSPTPNLFHPTPTAILNKHLTSGT